MFKRWVAQSCPRCTSLALPESEHPELVADFLAYAADVQFRIRPKRFPGGTVPTDPHVFADTLLSLTSSQFKADGMAWLVRIFPYVAAVGLYPALEPVLRAAIASEWGTHLATREMGKVAAYASMYRAGQYEDAAVAMGRHVAQLREMAGQLRGLDLQGDNPLASAAASTSAAITAPIDSYERTHASALFAAGRYRESLDVYRRIEERNDVFGLMLEEYLLAGNKDLPLTGELACTLGVETDRRIAYAEWACGDLEDARQQLLRATGNFHRYGCGGPGHPLARALVQDLVRLQWAMRRVAGVQRERRREGEEGERETSAPAPPATSCDAPPATSSSGPSAAAVCGTDATIVLPPELMPPWIPVEIPAMRPALTAAVIQRLEAEAAEAAAAAAAATESEQPAESEGQTGGNRQPAGPGVDGDAVVKADAPDVGRQIAEGQGGGDDDGGGDETLSVRVQPKGAGGAGAGAGEGAGTGSGTGTQPVQLQRKKKKKQQGRN
jgi:hypothetical protein